MSKKTFNRSHADELVNRLRETHRSIQIIRGARQVGKTSMVTRVVESSGMPCHFASADAPILQSTEWIEQQWETARLLESGSGPSGALLVLDEVQTVPRWEKTVKHLWDEDSRKRRKLKVVVLGSASLLRGRGLTESLAGRFELLHMSHWSFPEMQEAFGWTFDQYIFYGAYPGAAPLIKQPSRWKSYVHDSVIETTISREILMLYRVDKPALLRRVLELGCEYSGQVFSYTKMLGRLQHRGNTVTLAHYLDLLSKAGMLTCLQKYSGGAKRQKNSIPKLQVLNTALVTASSEMNLRKAKSDRQFWGRLVESAVGAHLVNAAAGGSCEVFYWRDRNREVDFVVQAGNMLTAIEVRSGRTRDSLPGMEAFAKAFPSARKLLAGGNGIPVEEFLSKPVEHWVQR